MKVHYTAPYLLNPQHIITINLIGCGGTGSQMLGNLARMNEGLKALGHCGLQVYAFDGDEITDSNVGRQLFSRSDIGKNKAIVLITRLNQFFGTSWEAIPEHFVGQKKANIIVSCVDTAQARLDIKENIKGFSDERKANDRKQVKVDEPFETGYYWLDMGNMSKTGQVVLGTFPAITFKQPKSENQTASTLKDVVAMFPSLKTIKEVDQGPSCSLAAALNKQDLFINSIISQFGANMLWKLFREGVIKQHGCYVNLDNLIVNPIKIS